MSQTSPIAAPPPVRPDVHAAIARAAQATGVDFPYLLAQAQLESGLDPSARAPTSSAAGLYQFTQGTWLATVARHGAEHGLGWAGAAVADGRIADPAVRAQVLALRGDPAASAAMAAELAGDNRAALAPVLGRDPDAAELYLAHFLGSDGAARLLAAAAADPAQAAAPLLPAAAEANRAVFFAGRAPRSAGEVVALLRARMQAGLDAAATAAPAVAVAGPAFAGGPLAREFAAVRGAGAAGASMADTLATAFGLASRGDAPAHVRAAYGRLRAFGL